VSRSALYDQSISATRIERRAISLSTSFHRRCHVRIEFLDALILAIPGSALSRLRKTTLVRPIFPLLALLLLLGMCGTSAAQDDISAPSGTAGYARMPAASLADPAQSFLSSVPLLEFPSDAVTSRGSFSSDLNAANSGAGAQSPAQPNSAAGKSSPVGGVITGLDTVPTFAGAFAGQAGPSLGAVFPFIMVGNDPRVGGTTRIPTHITAVSLRLLNDDGSLRVEMPFAPFEDLTEDSPNFEGSRYTSGHRIQFADSVQRAEFFHSMDEDWHTVLGEPAIVNRVTFTIPRHINVHFSDGSVKLVQAYYAGHAANGDPFVELLDLLFNALNSHQVGNDINANNFTTDALNINTYPNTFLFSINNKGQFLDCCVLGFHTYYYEPGVTPQPRWLFNFVSWISPGLFLGGFQDVTALSHEISETFNDPFVNTRTPSWQFPGEPANSQVCQGNLETGDPVEVLSTATVSIPLRERSETFTYHPQTEALLQWFEMGATSDAIGGAFSYPNTSALPHSALPCPPK
jgi:hypothetical protein